MISLLYVQYFFYDTRHVPDQTAAVFAFRPCTGDTLYDLRRLYPTLCLPRLPPDFRHLDVSLLQQAFTPVDRLLDISAI